MSKRPRLEAPASSLASSPPPPLYGSKEYWEERYLKQFQVVEQANEVEESHDDDSPASEAPDSTLPYHSWYYTYEELRPLLLPLVVGPLDDSHNFLLETAADDTSDASDSDDNNDSTRKSASNETDGNDLKDKRPKAVTPAADEDSTLDPVKGSSDEDQGSVNANEDEENDNVDDEESDNVEDKQSGNVEDDESDNVEDDESDNVEDDKSDNVEDDKSDNVEDDESDNVDDVEDDDSESLERDSLARNGPIAILEIGCGDVPLGAGLASDLQALQDTNGIERSTLVTTITCTDYSKVVVDMMQKQHGVHPSATRNGNDCNAKSSHDSGVEIAAQNPLEFVVADARHLPYSDNSYTLVMEKGTLDAMLSDTDQGVADCIQIVAECARVASTCIVLISHLNALTIDGQRWLEEVVMGGLRCCEATDDTKIVWVIEVHGNSQTSQEDDDQEDDDKEDDNTEATTGPAVYIIHKQIQPGKATKGKSTVSVKFFSY